MKKERNNMFVPIFMIILLLVTIAIVIYGVDTYFFNNTWLSGDSWVSIIICLVNLCSGVCIPSQSSQSAYQS